MEYLLSEKDAVITDEELKNLLIKAIIKAMEKRQFSTVAAQKKLYNIKELDHIESLLIEVMEGKFPSFLI